MTLSTKRVAAAILAVTLGATGIASAQSYSDSQLLAEGQSAYDQTKCVKAARFLFAYMIRNPGSDNANNIQNAIDWCEANTTLFAGSSGKADSAAPQRPPKPRLELSQAPAAARDRRCDVYARVAVAQNEANLANGCGFGGARWTSTYSHHYDWCLGVSSQETRAETGTRQQELDRCAP